jgi:hypothetical protein
LEGAEKIYVHDVIFIYFPSAVGSGGYWRHRIRQIPLPIGLPDTTTVDSTTAIVIYFLAADSLSSPSPGDPVSVYKSS